MCGIAGIYRLGDRPPTDDERAADRALVEKMLAAIRYRGPDDEGLESAGRATLGVRRLSILDVAGGHQPLSDASGRVWAIQNGEIYNFPELRRDLAARHPLRTHTDTELYPYLWLERGPGAVEALRGMFAAAIYDTRDHRLLLARDPLGVKPLYLAEHGQRLLFASEIKALLADESLPRAIDAESLGLYLALGFVPGERTMLAKIRKLRPGCRALVTPGGARVERYWPWPRFDRPMVGVSLESATSEARRLLADSAEAMLLSDVPVGLLLSGGLDSSVLAALLPEPRRRELLTFCIGFDDAGQHDERRFARTVAQALGTRHHEHVVSLDLAAELPAVARYLDEPCADPAAVPAHLVARAASSEVKVLLSGTGGDEVFGGYRRYRLGSLLRRIAWLPRSLAASAAGLLENRDQHRRTESAQRLVWLRKLLEARTRPDFFAGYLTMFEQARPSRMREGLASSWRDRARPELAAARIHPLLLEELGAEPAGGEATAFSTDFLFYLPDDLLLKEDRCCMGASVEGRVPYLDPSLVRFAATLTGELRRGPEGSKRLLRRIGRELLPAEIAARPKHGFTVPVEDWLRGPLDPLIGDLAASPGSGVFDRAVLRRWHAEHRAGRDRSGALWLALMFELWWREVGSGAGAVAPVGAGR
ncbi:MAG TPA: asparagine synthase (glutamine-hydrolyzing) [Candidatus Sulfotelmatobacter sp.]|nr:asparagine synthase (glutamine-hydrolyzing) [Candidatus Sulfotelmatobacter sp.]